MLDSLTLTSIILAELAFVLLLACGMLSFVLLRDRRQHQRLLKAYQKLRQTIRTDRAQSREEAEQRGEGSTDPVMDYFVQARDAARQRYRNITQTTLPRLSPEHPFNAKIAALRFLYCEAEYRAHRKSQASGDVWVLLERQLHDIVRWVVDREDTKPARQRNNPVKLLQQRVEKLKGFEKLSRDLQRKLDLNQQKREELERLSEEYQLSIDKLQRINNALSLAQEIPVGSENELRQKLQDILAEQSPHQQSQQQLQQQAQFQATQRRMTNIEHFSDDNQRLNSELARGLRAYTSEFPDERGEHLENTIKRLEAELYRSERHIAELKQQHSANDEAEIQTTVQPAATLASTPASMETAEGRTSAMGQIEETLKVIHTSMADSTSALSSAVREDRSQSPYSLVEIQQLRGNNVRQRNLIVDLEGELRHLQEAIPHTEDEDLRERQTLEMHRLESLVKECEHCILALESEVEMLHNQLQERQARLQAEADRAHAEINPQHSAHTSPESAEQLQRELEAMSERLQSSHQDTLLKQFAMESVKAQSIEEIARAMFGTLKRAELIGGFHLESKLGNAEYFPAKHFSDKDRSLVRRTTMATDIAYLNEGILFAGKHLHLMLKAPPEDEQELAQVEHLLHDLLELCSGRIDSLELTQLSSKHNRALEEWSMTAHNTLVNMEISYAYQAEESMHLIENLVGQIQRACKLATMSDSTRAVIENALSECQHRLRHLFVDGTSVDDGCTHLLEQLDHMPRTLS